MLDADQHPRGSLQLVTGTTVDRGRGLDPGLGGGGLEVGRIKGRESIADQDLSPGTEHIGGRDPGQSPGTEHRGGTDPDQSPGTELRGGRDPDHVVGRVWLADQEDLKKDQLPVLWRNFVLSCK